MWYQTLVELPDEGKAVLGLAIVATISFAIVYIRDWNVRRTGERLAKMKRERLNEHRQFAADVLVNGFENAVYEGKLSRDDANYLYKNFAHQLAVWDLYPRRLEPKHPNPDDLKEQIKGRLKNGAYATKIPEPERPKDELEAFLLDGIKHAAM